jgi:uncharacterized membrane protein YebE (DUF533 family)
VTRGGQRDGEAPALQRQALDEGAAAAGPERPAHRPIQRPESIIQLSLAQKVLHGWMQNRHQTLYPLALTLRNMNEAEKRLIIGAMAFALQAGEADERSGQRAEAWLRSVGGGGEDVAALAEARLVPYLIDRFVAGVRSAGQGPQAYAAAVGALGRRGIANRRFHDYLAARLGVADEVARSMNRRYGGQGVTIQADGLG